MLKYDIYDEGYEVPNEYQDKLDKAAYCLIKVLKVLYSKEPLNISYLEEHIDDLCHSLDVELFIGDLQIERKNEIVSLLKAII